MLARNAWVLAAMIGCSSPAVSGSTSTTGGSSGGASASSTSSSSADDPTSGSEGADVTSATSSDDSTSTGGTDTPSMTDCAAVPCHYVLSDAVAGGDGASWATAFATLPEPAERGAVYFFGDGEYGQLMLDEPEADDAWITLRKATEHDHGVDVGWDPAYGDGQAMFTSIVMVSDRWLVDGQVRDEQDWTDSESYGFRVTGRIEGHTINFGRASNDARFQYIDIGGAAGDEFDETIPSEGFYFGGFDAVIERWTISHSHVHNVYLPFQLAGAQDVTIEYSWLGPNWSKETIRGQGRSARITIRFNVLKDGCQAGRLHLIRMGREHFHEELFAPSSLEPAALDTDLRALDAA
jgi:hypothetical protein